MHITFLSTGRGRYAWRVDYPFHRKHGRAGTIHRSAIIMSKSRDVDVWDHGSHAHRQCWCYGFMQRCAGVWLVGIYSVPGASSLPNRRAPGKTQGAAGRFRVGKQKLGQHCDRDTGLQSCPVYIHAPSWAELNPGLVMYILRMTGHTGILAVTRLTFTCSSAWPKRWCICNPHLGSGYGAKMTKCRRLCTQPARLAADLWHFIFDKNCRVESSKGTKSIWE